MNLFNTPQEKGSSEWKSIGNVLRERRADLYPVAKKKVVHLRVQPSLGFHQQFFILKNAR